MTRTVWLPLILVLIGIAASALGQTAQPDASATIVLLVRHAEKAAQPADDPPLTPDGRRRAEALALAVKDAQPTAIITTQLRRTAETAQPSAAAAGVTPEVVRVSAANPQQENCDPIPTGLSLEHAAVFRGAYSTAYHALLQRGRLVKGDRVLIHGAAGGIGIPAIQIAKLFGAEVIATASTNEKRSVCLAEGADHAIDYQSGFRDTVMELTGGRGVDIIYDPVNGPRFEESLRCLAWGGRILILGFLGGPPALARTNYLLIKGIEIGVRIGGLNEAHPEIAATNSKTLLDLAGQGKLKPRIWRSYPLSEAARAVHALIDRQVIGKAVLVG